MVDIFKTQSSIAQSTGPRSNYHDNLIQSPSPLTKKKKKDIDFFKSKLRKSVRYGIHDLDKYKKLKEYFRTAKSEIRLHEYAEDRWIVKEDSTFAQIQLVAKIIVLLVMMNLYPFIAAFRYNWEHPKNIMFYTDLIEVFFIADILINCFREYTPENEINPVRNYRMCFLHYFQTKMLIDFIAIIPLQKILLKNERNHLWFLIKLVRIKVLQEKFDKRQLSFAIAKFLFKVRNIIWNNHHIDTPDIKF